MRDQSIAIITYQCDNITNSGLQYMASTQSNLTMKLHIQCALKNVTVYFRY